MRHHGQNNFAPISGVMRACASLIRATQFMMYDKDQGGSIDMDECMEIFFRRFGKLNLEVCKYGARTQPTEFPLSSY